jgi:hypothetical protein
MRFAGGFWVDIVEQRGEEKSKMKLKSTKLRKSRPHLLLHRLESLDLLVFYLLSLCVLILFALPFDYWAICSYLLSTTYPPI